MPRIRTLEVNAQEQESLLELRDHASKPYVRERASALLQVADGKPAAEVARQGLLRERQPDTVYGWLDRYEAEGAEGLFIRSGRGRKPAYAP